MGTSSTCSSTSNSKQTRGHYFLTLAAHSLTLSPSHQAHLLLKTQNNHRHNHSQAGKSKKKKPRYLNDHHGWL